MGNHFDVLVIGGGSGGVAHARRAASYGAKAALIESGRLGGTCVNVGCVPKKVMWYAAQHAHHFRHAAEYGFDIDVRGHDWAALKSGRDAYVAWLNGIYAKLLAGSGVESIAGRGRFLDSRTVSTGDRKMTADRIVIATGGRPTIPAIEGAGLGITSDGFFELGTRPASVLIAGSGYVAVELAGVFGSLGTETRVVVRKDGVLRDFDPMLGGELLSAMRSAGIAVDLNVVPASVEKSAGGLVLTAADGRRFGPVECLVWAIGREPNSGDIGLEAAGVARDAAGFIPVDRYQQTNVEHIFAIGDITGRNALTPVAIAAGRRLADRLYGGMRDRHLDYDCVPTVVFSHPPVGTVGLTEPQARKQYGDAVTVHTSDFTGMYYALGSKRQRSHMKLVTVGPEERIVGCHAIGEGADEMLQGFAVAVRMGATKADFDDTIAIHPTSAEEMVTMR